MRKQAINLTSFRFLCYTSEVQHGIVKGTGNEHEHSHPPPPPPPPPHSNGASAIKCRLTTFAAVLVMVGLTSPVFAQPEAWLHPPSGSPQEGSLTFNLTCPAGPNPNRSGSGSYNATEPHHYRASTYFRVEARNVAGNAGDQEMLPDDHAGRAWGKTMWCELWGGCSTLVRPKELDIMLRVTPDSNITMSDSSSSATGTQFMVTRRYGTWPDSVAISDHRPCPSFGHSYPVTITATIVATRELN